VSGLARLDRTDRRLLVSFFAVVIPVILYLCRAVDDNRLTSWQWTFAGISVGELLLLLLLATGVAAIFARYPFCERRPILLPALAFLASSFFWSEPEVIVDAARYFTQAKYLSEHGLISFLNEWGKDVFAWTDLPLTSLLYGLGFQVFGEQRLVVQVINGLFFSATVSLTYLLGRELWDRETGTDGALLLLAIPYLLIQVPLMLVDIPTMFFFLLAIYLFTRALLHGTVAMVLLAALAIFAAFWVKYSNWVLLSSLAVVIPVCATRVGATAAIRRGGAAGLLGSLMIAAAIAIYCDVITDQMVLLTSYQKPGLGRWGESLASTFFFQTHPFVAGAALLSTYVALARRDGRYIIIFWALFLLIFVLHVKRIRYTLPAFPMLTLMAAYGLKALEDRETRSHIVFSAVFSAFAVALVAYLPFLQGMSAANLRDAGKFLDSLPVSRVQVVTLAPVQPVVNPAVSVPLLDLFTKQPLVHIGEEPTIDPAVVATSPLRFTWEYRLPPYYLPDETGNSGEALAIISDTPDPVLPPPMDQVAARFPAIRSFAAAADPFQHKTFVTVYHN